MNALIINCSPVKTGATQAIIDVINNELKDYYNVKTICIDDYDIKFCKGCRNCHKTAKCEIKDDFLDVVKELDNADKIISVSPSYWADVPGQFKSFIDRWTPWCNTHEPYAKLKPNKEGYTVVLRTGPNMKECERLIETIEHFYGHLEINKQNHIGFTKIENKEDVLKIENDIKLFCKSIINE